MKKILTTILMTIIVWYGSQAVVGLVIGFIAALAGLTMDTIFMPVCIVGIITSIIAEVIYFKKILA